MSNLKIRTSDIPTSWLDARCRNLISKYALIAHRHDGTIFEIRGESILVDIGTHASFTDNRELRELYVELKNQLRALLASPSIRSKLNVMAEPQSREEPSISSSTPFFH